VVKAGGSAARSGLDGRLSGYLKKKRLQQVLPFIPPGARVLDVGCDDAALLEHLPADTIYVGLDSRAATIELNRRQFRRANVEFVHGDLAAFSWPGAPFDAVILAAVLEHLDGLGPALAALYPLVAANGRLVATTPAPCAHYILRAGAAVGLFARASLNEHKNYFSRRDFIGLPGWELQTYQRFELGLNQLLVLRRLSRQETGP